MPMKKKKRIVPNSRQDQWLKYLINNLNQIDELDWVQELLQIVVKIEEQFNTGKYRGAVFHLNFRTNERKKLFKH